MKRMSLCWLAASLGLSLAAARGEVPGAKPAAAGVWPRIIRSGPTEGPPPKVYHFDISAAAGRPGQPIPTAADGRVRPAAVTLPASEPAALEFPDPSQPIEAPPQAPKHDRPPAGAEAMPVPYDFAPPLMAPGAGGLGGIPTFTHDYCPIYWGDPWEGYCCERWRRHFGRFFSPSGRVYQTPAELGEGPCSCCQACPACQCQAGQRPDEAPLPPELPAIVPDRAAPRNTVPERIDDEISAPRNDFPAPTKRRVPHNELPQAPK